MRMIFSSMLLLAAASASVAAAAPAMQPSVELKVAPAERVGEYRVDIAVTNLATKKSLASPMLLVKSGEPGSVRVDLPEEMTVTISVMVDGSAQRLSYETQILDHDRAIANSAAEISLK